MVFIIYIYINFLKAVLCVELFKVHFVDCFLGDNIEKRSEHDATCSQKIVAKKEVEDKIM